MGRFNEEFKADLKNIESRISELIDFKFGVADFGHVYMTDSDVENVKPAINKLNKLLTDAEAEVEKINSAIRDAFEN